MHSKPLLAFAEKGEKWIRFLFTPTAKEPNLSSQQDPAAQSTPANDPKAVSDSQGIANTVIEEEDDDEDEQSLQNKKAEDPHNLKFLIPSTGTMLHFSAEISWHVGLSVSSSIITN